LFILSSYIFAPSETYVEKAWNLSCTDNPQGWCNQAAADLFTENNAFGNCAITSGTLFDRFQGHLSYRDYPEQLVVQFHLGPGGNYLSNPSGSDRIQFVGINTDPSWLAHETGHAIHARAMEHVPTFLGRDPNFVPNECRSTEDPPCAQKTATAQAWADFIAAVAFHEPYQQDITPYNRDWLFDAEGLMGGRYNNSNSNMPCAALDDPDGVAWDSGWNIVRFFWDLYDTRDEGDYSDGCSMTIGEIISVWTNFTAGTGDGQADEGSTPDPYPWSGRNGRNVWDYWNNAPDRLKVCIERNIMNNCLTDSERSTVFEWNP